MSFLSAWFAAPAPPTATTTATTVTTTSDPELASVTITVEADEDENEDDENEDDTPPSFPAPNSTQRAQTSQASLGLPPSTTRVPAKPRKKVVLAPGHSPLDWARLTASGTDLRGTPALLRVTPAMLAEHRTRADAWTAIGGKVYNITPYLDFHPGGVPELMRVAGRDGTKLFALTHSWVSVDMMLGECMVGMLVAGQ